MTNYLRRNALTIIVATVACVSVGTLLYVHGERDGACQVLSAEIHNHAFDHFPLKRAADAGGCP